MPSIPPVTHDADHAVLAWPTDVDREALRLVRQLTPTQRHLIVRAGLPRWMRLATPWSPAPGREAALARKLASRDFGILEPLPREKGAYQLTPLGERVAGIALLNVLTLS